MKRVTINQDKSALADAPAEQLTPQPGPPAVHHPHRIVLTIGGKRYEFTLHTEVREVLKGPAKVIAMTGR